MYITFNNNYNNNQRITHMYTTCTVSIALPEHPLAVKVHNSHVHVQREHGVGIKKTYMQALCSTYVSAS